MAKNYFLIVLADSEIHRFQSAPLGMCFLDKVIDICDSQEAPGYSQDALLCLLSLTHVFQCLTLTTVWFSCNSSVKEKSINSVVTV